MDAVRGEVITSPFQSVSSLAGLLPLGTGLAEATDTPFDLFPSELEALGKVSDTRHRDHGAGRALARQALGLIGFPAVEIPVGPSREPIWPKGVVGSITHCRGFAAAVVARSTEMASLGIDAEVNIALEPALLQRISHTAEREALERFNAAGALGILLFSAKESVFKAWFPLTGSWLDFTDALVTFDWQSGRFTAQIRSEKRHPRAPGTLTGRFRVARDHVFTTAFISSAL